MGFSGDFARSFDIAVFLSIIHFEYPANNFEIRVPQCPSAIGSSRVSTVSGTFSDAKSAEAAILALDTRCGPPGIYLTCNPIRSSIATNKLATAGSGQATKDDGILKRNWLLIDIDPKRATKTSSTNDEMEIAWIAGDKIDMDLTQAGWPVPLRAMSGNGAYLLYRIELPNDEESSILLRECLHALAARHSSETIDVDRSVHNASRIIKAIGTWARKGENTADRPHRQSWFIPNTEPLQVVSRELLEALAATNPAAEKKTKSKKSKVDDGLDDVSSIGASQLPDDDPILMEIKQDAIKALSELNPGRADNREHWLNVGWSLHYISRDMLPHWIEWSKQSPKFNEAECRQIWQASNRDGGITNETLHGWANEDSGRKLASYMRKFLGVLADLSEDSTTMALEVVESRNRQQDYPIIQGKLLDLFQSAVSREIRRRSHGGGIGEKSTESNAAVAKQPISAPTIDDSKKNHREDELAKKIEALDEPSAELMDSLESQAKLLAEKETVTDEDKSKIIQSLSRVAKAFSNTHLPSAIGEYIAQCSLERHLTEPVLFVLHYPNLSTHTMCSVSLSGDEIGSFVSVEKAIDKQGSCFIQPQLTKHWRTCKQILRSREIVLRGDKELDIRSAIAQIVIEECRQAQSLEDAKKRGNSKHVIFHEKVFFDGNPAAPDTFWMHYETMLMHLQQKNNAFTRRIFGGMMKANGIISTPLRPFMRRFHKIDELAWNKLKIIAGSDDPFHIRSYDDGPLSSKNDDDAYDGKYTATGINSDFDFKM